MVWWCEQLGDSCSVFLSCHWRDLRSKIKVCVKSRTSAIALEPDAMAALSSESRWGRWCLEQRRHNHLKEWCYWIVKGTTQMPIHTGLDGSTDKMLYSKQDKPSTAIHDSTDGSCKCKVKWKKSDGRVHEYDSMYIKYTGSPWRSPCRLVTQRDNEEGGFWGVANDLFVILGANETGLSILQSCERLYTDNICTFLYISIKFLRISGV